EIHCSYRVPMLFPMAVASAGRGGIRTNCLFPRILPRATFSFSKSQSEGGCQGAKVLDCQARSVPKIKQGVRPRFQKVFDFGTRLSHQRTLQCGDMTIKVALSLSRVTI